MVTLDPAVERADLIESLRHHCHRAKRDMPVVGKDEDHPTPWDLSHRRLDEEITELEAMDRECAAQHHHP